VRGLACLFLFALASPFLAGLFSLLIGPLLVVVLVLGVPAVFWHRWKHPPLHPRLGRSYAKTQNELIQPLIHPWKL